MVRLAALKILRGRWQNPLVSETVLDDPPAAEGRRGNMETPISRFSEPKAFSFVWSSNIATVGFGSQFLYQIVFFSPYRVLGLLDFLA